ncbi:MAG: hypothetical protein AABX71_01845 [Nanoarchaeota archaeon]
MNKDLMNKGFQDVLESLKTKQIERETSLPIKMNRVERIRLRSSLYFKDHFKGSNESVIPLKSKYNTKKGGVRVVPSSSIFSTPPSTCPSKGRIVDVDIDSNIVISSAILPSFPDDTLEENILNSNSNITVQDNRPSFLRYHNRIKSLLKT